MRWFQPDSWILLGAALLLFRIGVGAQTRSTSRSSAGPQALPFFDTNQRYIEGLGASFDPRNLMGVFALLFRNLPRDVFIRPTENYYYFSFLADGRLYRGNFRLSAENRDKGLLNFIYYEYQDEPAESDEAATWYAALGPAEGVRVRKLSERAYAVQYSVKKVIFHLPAVPQTPPVDFPLGPNERFVERICDESGYRFLLLFDEERDEFAWALDTEGYPLPRLDSLREDLAIDRLSGFIFLADPRNGRKTLVGVASRNVRRNNYWDGPFDQLAENENIPALLKYLERAYPYARGKLDLRGNFLEESGGGRLPITPYMEYDSVDTLVEAFIRCRKKSGGDALPCLAHDYKHDFEPGEP